MRLAVSAVALSVIARLLVAQSPTGTIVSANMTANSASVVDIATGQLRATYPTGPGPHEVAVSNDGRWAVISVYGNRESVGHCAGKVAVIDIASARVLKVLAVGGGSDGVGFSLVNAAARP